MIWFLSCILSLLPQLFALKAFRVEGARASVCTKRASSLKAYRAFYENASFSDSALRKEKGWKASLCEIMDHKAKYSIMQLSVRRALPGELGAYRA